MKFVLQYPTLCIIVLTILGLTGCQTRHYYYYQSAQQVNLFKEKKEFKLSGQINSGDANSGGGAQAAYAITKHISAGASIMSYNNSKNHSINGMSTGSWSGRSFGAYGGYTYSFGKYGMAEAQAGAEFGNEDHAYADVKEETVVVIFFPVTNYTVTPIGNAIFNYQKYFLQPAYGFRYENFELAASTRLSYLNFHRINMAITPGYTVDTQVEKIDKNRNYLFFEPGFTFRAGWNMIKFQIHYFYSNTLIGRSIRQDNHFLGCGISLAISGSKLIKKEKPKQENQ